MDVCWRIYSSVNWIGIGSERQWLFTYSAPRHYRKHWFYWLNISNVYQWHWYRIQPYSDVKRICDCRLWNVSHFVMTSMCFKDCICFQSVNIYSDGWGYANPSHLSLFLTVVSAKQTMCNQLQYIIFGTDTVLESSLYSLTGETGLHLLK